MLQKIKNWWLGPIRNYPAVCLQHGHRGVEFESEHLHFEKGEHQTTTYCFSGKMFVCLVADCSFEKFFGDPAMYVVGCEVTNPNLRRVERRDVAKLVG